MGRAIVVILFVAAFGTAGAAVELSDIQWKTVEECEPFLEEQPRDLYSYLCVYLAARNHQQWDEAIARLEAQLELQPDNPRARLYLGSVVADIGQPRAEQLFRAAVEGFEREDEIRGEVWSRVSLATNLQYQFRFDDAGGQLGLAHSRAEQSDDPLLLAEVVLNQGWNKHLQAEHGPAWTLFRQAESVIVPDGPNYLQVRVEDGLASAAWGLGMYLQSFEHYGRQLDLMGDSNPMREAGVRSRRAMVARELRSVGVLTGGDVIRLEREALDSAVRSGSLSAETTARLLLAESSDVNLEERIEHAVHGLRLAREMRLNSDICWALCVLAETTLAREPGRADEAFRLVAEAHSLATQMGDVESLARATNARSKLYLRIGDRQRGIESGFATLDQVERIRDLQLDREVRARVFSRFADVYRALAGYLLSAEENPSAKDVERAFQTVERMRARILLDSLDAGRLTETLTSDDPIVEERALILEKIAEIQRRLLEPDVVTTKRQSLLGDLGALELRELAIRELVAAAHPHFATVRSPVIPSLEQLRRSLADDQALVSYVLSEAGEGGSWALVISRDEVHPVPLPHCGLLHREIRMYSALLQRRDGSERQASERLHGLLLAEVLDRLPPRVRRLVIVPDGAMHRLPFGALHRPNGQPMATEYEICLVPSLSIWWRWSRESEPTAEIPVLAFADPAVGSAARPAEHRSIDLFAEGAELGALPHARREVRTMTRMLGGRSRSLTGEDATEHTLKQIDLGHYRIIHLAVHALVDEQRPDRSAVLLAPGADGEDGLLQFREVVDLNLDGQIVILSACRSASGPVIGGDGVMGLAHAFFLAGSRTVVAGLWPLRDDEVSLLMEEFARELAGGRTVAAALTSAKRTLIRGGAPAAAWAGLVVLGEGDQVPLPGGRSRRIGAVTAALASALVLGALAVMVVLALRPRRRPAHRPL